jgi:hypothetical protein
MARVTTGAVVSDWWWSYCSYYFYSGNYESIGWTERKAQCEAPGGRTAHPAETRGQPEEMKDGRAYDASKAAVPN